MRFAILLPTLNASNHWDDWQLGLASQTLSPDAVFIVDSSSDDDTALRAKQAGFCVVEIQRAEFSHGATRQLGVELIPEGEILIYLTQDAVLANPESLERIIAAFSDPGVGAAYGRQLPRKGAGPIEAHARSFNYPSTTQVKTLADREHLGCKAIFMSNSFAAYRRSALMSVGGFPKDVIVGEDSYVAAKMLLSGRKIVYVADATVYHSHAYSFAQEFRRYFDMGAFHSRQPWLTQQFGSTSGEGLKFVRSEFAALWPRHFWLIPSALFRSVIKFLGYRLGQLENRLTIGVKRRLSMHSNFWQVTDRQAQEP